ncbi:MAG: TonB-dependent receptor plug domain-containing protein, partial [Desulfobacterales bacterium]|nr:TonB-dependent receptor plug domain-containing protein [Desulfobacterales bacterium]
MRKRQRALPWIAIFFLLCNPATIFASEPKTVDEMFEVSFEELMELEVSVATRFSMASEETPAIVSVVTAEEIRNMGARDMIDILRMVPGFDLVHMIQRPIHQGVVRGISPGNFDNSIVILMNGHALGAGSYGGSPGYFFDSIPVANIEKIEIIRGPGSALYGSDAFNGVVNIITKKGGDEPSRLSVKAGSFNTWKYEGEFSYAKNDLKAYLYADYHTADGPAEMIESDMATITFGPDRSAAPGRTTENSSYYTVFTNLDYKIFYFSGYFQKLEAEIPVGLAKALTDEDDIDLFYTYFDLGAAFPIT